MLLRDLSGFLNGVECISEYKLSPFLLYGFLFQEKRIQAYLVFLKDMFGNIIYEYAGVPLEKRSVQPEQIPDMKQYSDIILYGDASSPEAQQQLAEYLQQHNSLKVQLSFFDKRNDSTSKDEQAIAYAELQKALFFCQRKKIPLLFVSLKGMIDDIRFLNLLEESHVDFRCIDFPWFCKENLPLIKAVVLYEKLEIRINV